MNPLTFSIPPNLRVPALAFVALLTTAALVLIAVVVYTGGDLGSPRITTPLGFAFTIISIILVALGLGNQVAAQNTVMHTSINGRMTQLVDASASAAFQAGQTAGLGAPVPTPPVAIPPDPQVPPASSGVTTK